MGKIWQVAPAAPEDFINKFSEFSPLLAQLFYNRQVLDPGEAKSFLESDYEEHLHDPFLFSQMKTAVERILKAAQNNENILIYGDYDADGVTSSAVLGDFFRLLGIKHEIYIPHREEDGFGLNLSIVEEFIKQKIDLLITVDCGTSNVKEIEKAKLAGIDMIVTDHHQLSSELPQALALINPSIPNETYPFKYLCGVGVAYKLVQALCIQIENDKPGFLNYSEMEKWGGLVGVQKWLLDLVAIGTVADLAKLSGENRVLVKWGLKVLAKTRRPGLIELMKIIQNKQMNSFTIGYQIAPRLNAAGRLGSARSALDLLLTQDQSEAEKLAAELQSTNGLRQRKTDEIVKSAREQVQALEKMQNCLMVYGDDWQPGLVGLVAGKLCEEFYRPVLAMSGINGSVVGSGRSISQLDITKALGKVSQHLSRFGGHAQACGFTLKDADQREYFQTDLLRIIDQELKDQNLKPIVNVDYEMSFKEIDWGIVNELEHFEPFGEGNSKPRFLIRKVQVDGFDVVGSSQAHLKLLVNQSSRSRKMIAFGIAQTWKDKLSPGTMIDAIVELGIHEWNGFRDIEMRVIDLRLAKH